ncbi:transposase [Nocardia terpenica]|uniref:transposase n=1 Tax=Nocardia terpenica TaxID=455432 RepID=UPI0031835109
MRGEFYACLTARGDELFELTDAVLCAQGAVRSVVELTLTPEHRRGHGALYDGLNDGRIDVQRLRNMLSSSILPRFGDGRLVLAVDVSAWLRSDAECSPDRLFCHVYGRAKSASQFISGLAVFVRGRARTRWEFVDADPGRGAPGSSGRRGRSHRHPVA